MTDHNTPTPYGAASAAVHGTPPRLPFLGQDFTLADDVPAVILLDYAHVTLNGLSTTSDEGLVLLREIVLAVLADEADYERWRELARRHRTTLPELWRWANEAWAQVAGRPTSPPSGSPDGQSTTGPSSTSPPDEPDSPAPEPTGNLSPHEQLKRDLGLVPIDQLTSSPYSA